MSPSSLISPSSVFTSQLCKLYIRQIDRLPCQLLEMSQVLLVCARVKVSWTQANFSPFNRSIWKHLSWVKLWPSISLHSEGQTGEVTMSKTHFWVEGNFARRDLTLCLNIYIFFITVMITSQKTFRPTLASNISGNVLASCQSKIWTFSRMKMIFVWQQ